MLAQSSCPELDSSMKFDDLRACLTSKLEPQWEASWQVDGTLEFGQGSLVPTDLVAGLNCRDLRDCRMKDGGQFHFQASSLLPRIVRRTGQHRQTDVLAYHVRWVLHCGTNA
jgi:hypothetical protein